MSYKGICPVCNFTYSNMMNHLMRQDDVEHKKYLENLNQILDKLILETDLYTQEIADEIASKDLFISKGYVQLRIQQIELGRGRRVLSTRRMGFNNPVHNPGVAERISKTVSDKWIKGTYKDRINGMLGVVGEKSPNYKSEIHSNSEEAKRFYVTFLSKFEDVSRCKRCNSTENINIHHIDEDHSNILISNLEANCVPCHMMFHHNPRILPFVTIAKKLSFAASHKLPFYIGKCENWHGHEWEIEVFIKKRIDPATMMVMDFKDLKKIIDICIINILDHNCVNDVIEIPTAENMLVWCWEQLMFVGHLKGIEKITLWENRDSSSSISKEGMLSVFKKKINEE